MAIPALLLVSAAPAWCYEDGAPPGHTGGFGEADCSACHADFPANPAEGRLIVLGWPDRPVPGRRYDLVLLLEHPELESGGFQIAIRTPGGAQAGELAAVAPRTKIVADRGVQYLQHTADGREAEGRGSIRWRFAWTAGPASEAVLHAAANAANDDLSALGDYVVTLEKRSCREESE